MKKLLFVYNPHAGRGEIGRALSDILFRFTKAGYLVTARPTLAPRDGQEFIAAHAGEYDLVVCSGGDGMLHELFSGIINAGEKVNCGYIPAGTVNDFAASLKISRSPLEAADMLMKGHFRQIDAGVFNSRTFAYVAAFGMFTAVSYSTDQRMKNALGAAAYVIDALRSLDLIHFQDAAIHARVQVNGQEWEDDFLFGMAGNTLSVAGIPNLVPPGARMDDGLLDYLLIRMPRSIQEFDRIRAALMGRRLNAPEILCGQAPTLEIETDRPIQWTLDGEFGGETAKAYLGIREKAICLAAPEEKETK